MPMANISLCFGSNPCAKPLIVACKSIPASHDTSSYSSWNSNFYKMLSLSSNKAGTQEIKKAYKTLALKYHPDVSHDQDTTEMFVLLQIAYKTLVDPELREHYDLTLRCRDDGHVEEARRWEGQIVELKRRSSFRSERKEGSWGSRVRYANSQN
ncbi:dnaJ domain-containing protein [Artemisia annua]|uniref:DnaJ domain-containing protein n=1 Tax=Artemisia annua TaxID=35608 RepID=A0A2U1Q3P6_ARTAN|nr:dnaJ domain-containing protein [Artemisia annua]